jgi:hypothetical protein
MNVIQISQRIAERRQIGVLGVALCQVKLPAKMQNTWETKEL